MESGLGDQPLEQEYQTLVKRLGSLKQTRAVLLAREEDKRKERTILEDQLKAEGIDVTNPNGEISRLEAEIKEEFLEATKKMDEFEQELKKL